MVKVEGVRERETDTKEVHLLKPHMAGNTTHVDEYRIEKIRGRD